MIRIFVRLAVLQFAVLLFSVSTLWAQAAPTEQPAPPPYDVFPLGGYNSYGGPTTDEMAYWLPRFGLNCAWSADRPLGPGLGRMADAWDGDLGYFFPGGTYNLGYDTRFQQWDFDLVSNEKPEELSAWDLKYVSWDKNTGVVDHLFPRELLFSTPDASGVFLQASGSNAINVYGMRGTSDDDLLGRSNVLFVDFISRLSSDAHYGTSVDPDDPVYAIEAIANVSEWQSSDQGNSWQPVANKTNLPLLPTGVNPGDPTCPTCVYITKGDYTNYGTNTYAALHDGNDYNTELPNVLSFPNKDVKGVTKSNDYAVFRLKFDIVAGGFDGNQTTGTTWYKTAITSMSFKLKGTDNSYGIYVRGIRIRSNWADAMFRGKFDNSRTAPSYDAAGTQLALPTPFPPGAKPEDQFVIPNGLQSIFDRIKSDPNYRSYTAARVGNESNWPCYRLFAYINEKLRKATGRHLVLAVTTPSIGAVNYENATFYRGIYNDQSYTPTSGFVNPPPLQVESGNLGKTAGDPKNQFDHFEKDGHLIQADQLIFAGDAITSAVKNHVDPDFIEFGRNITGWNDGTMTYGGTQIGGAADQDDYVSYTSRMQHVLNGISAQNKSAAISTHPRSLPSSAWGTFYAMPSAWEVTNEYHLQMRSIPYAPHFDGSAMQADLMAKLKSGIHDGDWGWKLPFNNNWPELPTVENWLMASSQPGTIPEIREQTWEAITWGAKGIVYNYMGSDRAGNIGFCTSHEDPVGYPPIPGFQTPQSGFSNDNGVENGDPDYAYYRLLVQPAEGYIIPPQTSATQTTPCFPDHLITVVQNNEIVNGNWLWIPCISDFDIWESSDRSSPAKIPAGQAVTPDLIATYLAGVIHYSTDETTTWCTPDANTTQERASQLQSYYETGCATYGPTSWKAKNWVADPGAPSASRLAHNGDKPPGNPATGGSDWLAANRDLLTTYNGPVREDRIKNYENWWDLPIPNREGINGVIYPSPKVNLDFTGTPTYFGFKDRADGIKRSMADIAGIAAELRKLDWITAFDYSDLDPGKTGEKAAENHDWATKAVPSFPFGSGMKNLRFQRYAYPFQLRTTAGDPTQSTIPEAQQDHWDNTAELLYQTLVNVGVFRDTADHDAQNHFASYVVLANKRTWPIIFKDGALVQRDETNPSKEYWYLGAIDARRLSFSLDNSTGGWVSTNWGQAPSTYYSISDLRGKTLWKSTDNGSTWINVGPEAVDLVATPSMFAVDLEPGEGTLLRVAPLSSLQADRCSGGGIAWNNAAHIAETPTQMKMMVWERKGRIRYALINHPAGTPLAAVTNNVSSVMDLSTPINSDPNLNEADVAENPSIAIKPDTQGQGIDTAVIVYSIQKSDRQIVSMAVGLGPNFSSWEFHKISNSAQIGLPSDPTLRPTPAIAPAKDGYYVVSAGQSPSGNSNESYSVYLNWIHVANGIWMYGQDPQDVYAISWDPLVTASGPSLACFPTVATRPDEYNWKEKVHIAWEERRTDLGTSEIYYKEASRQYAARTLTIATPELVSGGFSSCWNHHPMIAVTNVDAAQPGNGIVTWEANYPKRTCDNVTGFIPKGTVEAVVRTRYAPANWSSFETFYPLKDNLPQPVLRVGSDWTVPSGVSRTLAIQDTFANRIHFEHWWWNPMGQPKPTYVHTMLNEYGRQPGFALQTQRLVDDEPIKTMMFRGTTPDADALYAVRVNAYTSGLTSTVVKLLSQQIEVQEPYSCQTGWQFRTDEMSIGRPDWKEPVVMTDQGPTYLEPDTNVRRPISWSFYDLTSTQQSYVADTNIIGGTRPGWLRTEDSIVTNYFTASLGETITAKALLQVDTLMLPIFFPPESRRYVSYDLLMKDSASKEVVQTVAHFSLTNGGIELGPNQQIAGGPCTPQPPMLLRTITTVPITGTPASGKAYLTIAVRADSLSNLSMFQSQIYGTGFDYPEPWDGQALKPATPGTKHTVTLGLKVYPNPAEGVVSIETASDEPTELKIDIFDVLGHLALHTEGLRSPVRMDVSKFAPGSYFARATSGNTIETRRFEVLH